MKPDQKAEPANTLTDDDQNSCFVLLNTVPCLFCRWGRREHAERVVGKAAVAAKEPSVRHLVALACFQPCLRRVFVFAWVYGNSLPIQVGGEAGMPSCGFQACVRREKMPKSLETVKMLACLVCHAHYHACKEHAYVKSYIYMRQREHTRTGQTIFTTMSRPATRTFSPERCSKQYLPLSFIIRCLFYAFMRYSPYINSARVRNGGKG